MSNPNFLLTILTAQVAPSTIARNAPVELHANTDYTLRGNRTYIGANEHTVTVGELAEHARELDRLRVDITQPVRDLHFMQHDSALRMVTHRGSIGLREHAFDQIGERLSPSHGAPVARYVKAWDADMQALLLNKHIAKYTGTPSNPRTWMVRMFQGEARAVLSQGYATINNHNLFTEFEHLTHGQDLPELQVGPQSYVGPDSMRFDTVWRNVNPPEGAEGGYGVGISFTNNYIGSGKFTAACLLWRGLCRNSIRVNLNESTVSMVHRGHSAEHLAVASIQAFISSMIEQSGEVIEAMVKAENQVINVPDWSALFDAALPGATKLTDKERDFALIGTEGRNTVGGLINAFTFAAHQTGVSDARALELENAAGVLLMNNTQTMQIVERTARKAR